MSPCARRNSASARASQPRPSTPSTVSGWLGYAAPSRAISSMRLAFCTAAAARCVSPAARACQAWSASAHRPTAAGRITLGSRRPVSHFSLAPIVASASATATSVWPCQSACSASRPRPMYSVKWSVMKNGCSQVRRSATAGWSRATSRNRAIADSLASAALVTRVTNPSVSSCAWPHSPAW